MVTERLARPDAAKLFAKPPVDTKALSKRANAIRGLIKAAEHEYDDGVIDGRDLKRRRVAASASTAWAYEAGFRR